MLTEERCSPDAYGAGGGTAINAGVASASAVCARRTHFHTMFVFRPCDSATAAVGAPAVHSATTCALNALLKLRRLRSVMANSVLMIASAKNKRTLSPATRSNERWVRKLPRAVDSRQ